MSARKLRRYHDGKTRSIEEAAYQYLMDHAIKRNGKYYVTGCYIPSKKEEFYKRLRARRTHYRFLQQDIDKHDKISKERKKKWWVRIINKITYRINRPYN